MSKIELRFTYSPEQEKERVKNTINKTDWFIKHGYSEWIKLPENIKLVDVDVNLLGDLLNKVDDEYKHENYIEIENTVNEQWPKFSPKLEQYFIETQLIPEDLYDIQLTRYGTGGSYNLPNKVIVNYQSKFGIGVSKTIIHEIVHLSIQKYIDKYNTEHWKKERIVDRILSKIVPNIATMQNVPIDTKLIDETFDKYYPNIEEVIKNLK